ncbi:MAG TPA: glutamate-cysteine ligase family protein [Candidatus Bathyarchaeia archaeon]|nr:glutamate-cysteine ligase family protein [Candidatus Bathyarchaeia archaeon]
MSNISSSNTTNTSNVQPQRKLPFTQGIEIENFITNKQGEILEDGKELVAVWDQMFNGALDYLKSLTSSTTNVPEYIRDKIKRVTRQDVERHGKIIRYVQIQYQFNGKSIAINVFGPDPNISQITWLLELVTPPCEYLEELDWWINTLYLAASNSITRGYNIQPLGFNPYQSEYRAGVTCGEHHHLGGFSNEKEKKAAYNMLRAYIPHIMALSSTSPFMDGKATGRTLLKKGPDGRTLILAPDCIRSIRLKENSGQLGPNIPDYLPYLTPSFTQEQFSRYVRKEIPDDRYVDMYPFTSYGTIEMRFIDTQYDQRIRIAIIMLIQALALKGVKYVRSGNTLPEVKGNTIFEHRKRAVNFGMFAKFQGDPSIESVGGAFVKYYNHNPDTGGPPGKIYESLKSLLIWLKPELIELKITEEEITPLLIMLWGTSRIAPPISATTYMLYLYEQNHGNIASVINNLSLINGKPRKTFCEILGKPSNSFEQLFEIKAADPKRTADTTKSALARKLQQDSRQRRKTVMVKEQARLKAKQVQNAKLLREKVKREKELEQKRFERIQKLEKARKPPPKALPTKSPTIITRKVSIASQPTNRSLLTKSLPSKPTLQKTLPAASKKEIVSKHPQKKNLITKPATALSSAKKVTSKPVKTNSKVKHKQTKVIPQNTISNKKNQIISRKPAQAFASTAVARSSTKKQLAYSKPTVTQRTASVRTITKTATPKKVVSTTKTTTKNILEYESYKDNKLIRNVTIINLPSRVEYDIILPVVKINWKRSILQSMVSYSINVEAEVSALNRNNKFQKTVYQEKINLEKASLENYCYLPIPINLSNTYGEFQIKFIVRDLKDRRIIAVDYKTLAKEKPSKVKTHSIKSVSIPTNQVGDSLINLRAGVEKKNTRGKITIWAVSQRGIEKIYEKKSKIGQNQFSLDIPVLIPLSMCSSEWYIFTLFNARGTNVSTYTKTSPPFSKIIDVSLSGNPPLKQRVKTGFTSEITPKFVFKARCEIHEVEILQIEDGSRKVLKRYRLKTRIRKGERFVLESFNWKAPSLRKGLFRSAKQKTINFACRIIDNIGVINDSLIGITETPTITVTS